MEYTSNETNGVVKFSTNCIPPCFEKYATMLRNFSVYMDRNLRQNGKTSSKEEVKLLLGSFLAQDLLADSKFTQKILKILEAGN